MNIQEATLSTKSHKKLYIAGAAVAVASVVGLALTAPAANALPGLGGSDSNLDLGAGLNHTDGDESQSIGTRVASQDGLENLGVGLGANQTDGDESSSLGTQVESTDDLENLLVNTSAQTQDGDESSQVGAGVETKDNLDSVKTNVGASSTDGDETSNFGIKFGFEDE